MEYIRPIQLKDHAAFIALAESASIGMTSMPKNRHLLLKKIEESISAFAQEKQGENYYLFVLENGETKSIEGVAGLVSQTALAQAEYYFVKEKQKLLPFHPAVPQEITLLNPVKVHTGPSEICALFLARNARKKGLGRLLSLSRFLFIAAFPQRFTESVTALMRGYFDENSSSPFWNGVGRKFLNLDFLTLLHLRENGEAFVEEIFPKYPLYADLLDVAAERAIGQIHPHTYPALKMLQQEGFQETGVIDFFDGGPQIICQTALIRTIRESCVTSVTHIVEKFATPSQNIYLISNEKLDFRTTLAALDLTAGAMLTTSVAQALEVKQGDPIRYVLC